MKKVIAIFIILLSLTTLVFEKYNFNYATNNKSYLANGGTNLTVNLIDGTFSNGSSSLSYSFDSSFSSISATTSTFTSNVAGDFNGYTTECTITSSNAYYNNKYISGKASMNASFKNTYSTDIPIALEVGHGIPNGGFSIKLSDGNNTAFGDSNITCNINLEFSNTEDAIMKLIVKNGTYMGLDGQTTDGIIVFEPDARAGIKIVPKEGYIFDSEFTQDYCPSIVGPPSNNNIFKFDGIINGEYCYVQFKKDENYEPKITIDAHEVGSFYFDSVFGGDSVNSIPYSYLVNQLGDTCFSVWINLNDGITKDNILIEKSNVLDDSFSLECTGNKCTVYICIDNITKDSSVTLKYKEDEPEPVPEEDIPAPIGPTTPVSPVSELLDDETEVTMDNLECGHERVIIIDRVPLSSSNKNISYNLKMNVGTSKTAEIKNVSSLSNDDLGTLNEICQKSVASGKTLSGSKMSDILGIPNLSDVTINSDITTCNQLINTITGKLSTINNVENIDLLGNYTATSGVVTIPVKYQYSTDSALSPYTILINSTKVKMAFVGFSFEFVKDNCGKCFDDERLTPSTSSFDEELFKNTCCSSDDPRMTNEVKTNYCPYAACNNTPELTPGSSSFDEEKYRSTCCSIIDTTTSEYTNYCIRDNYSYQIPMCGIKDEENHGYIYEAGQKGIDEVNIEEVLTNKDYNDNSYASTNAYCTVACKEDVDLYFPGFAVSTDASKTGVNKYWIKSGSTFKFYTIDSYQTPTIVQTKTCIKTVNMEALASELYGEGSKIDNDGNITDKKTGKIYNYYLAYSKYQLELLIKDYINNSIESTTEGAFIVYKQKYTNPDYGINLESSVILDKDTLQIKSIIRKMPNENGRLITYDSSKEFQDAKYQTELNNIVAELNNITTLVAQCDNSWSSAYTTTANISGFNYSDKEKNVSNSAAIEKLNLASKIISDGKAVTAYNCNRDFSDCSDTVTNDSITIDLPNNNTVTIVLANEKKVSTQIVSFVVNEALYAIQPDGAIVSKSTYDGDWEKLASRRVYIGPVFPVDIVTRAAKLKYSYKISNIGDKGRLDDFYVAKYNEYSNTRTTSPQYVCNYVVANVIICSGLVYDNNNTSLLASITGKNTIASSTSDCLVDPDCDIVKNGNHYDVTCIQNEEYKTISDGELNVSTKNIDLTNIFPNSRIVSGNWSSEVGSSAKEDIQDKGNSIYSEEPLYSFILDTDKIKSIKEYNKTHDYNDFNLKCITDTGEECWSDFLTDYFPDSVTDARNNWKYFENGVFVQKTKR